MKKEKIPKSLKIAVWNQHIGANDRESFCVCCKNEPITINNFDCGHVVSEKNGGIVHLSNLRPICRACNGSMGTMNMNEFITKYGFDKINQKSSLIICKYCNIESNESHLKSDKHLELEAKYLGKIKCNVCNIFINKNSFKKHEQSQSHQLRLNQDIMMPKMNRECTICKKTFLDCNFDRHLKSKKHLLMHNLLNHNLSDIKNLLIEIDQEWDTFSRTSALTLPDHDVQSIKSHITIDQSTELLNTVNEMRKNIKKIKKTLCVEI